MPLRLLLTLVALLNVCNADQIHVAFSEFPNKLSVSWVSETEEKSPRIIFDGVMLTSTEMRTGLQRWFYHALTPELEPGRSYSIQHPNSPKVYEVTYPDQIKAEAEGFSVLWFADMGVVNVRTTLPLIEQLSKEADFTIHGGDISYADIRGPVGMNDYYNSIYDLWGEMMTNITTRSPYMVSPGNHETSCHSYADLFCHEDTMNFTYYRNRFRMPRNGPENMWYSYDYGFVHFVSLNTETDYPGSPEGGHDGVWNNPLSPHGGPFGDQLGWLEADLAANTKPWTVVYGHRPLWSSFDKGSPDWPLGTINKTRAAFQPILEKHGVDLYICGHKHGYERLHPMKGDKVVSEGGLLQIVSGAAGSAEGHDGQGSSYPFVAYKNWENWGVNMLKWTNITTLEISFIVEGGGVNDSVVLHKSELRPTPRGQDRKVSS